MLSSLLLLLLPRSCGAFGVASLAATMPRAPVQRIPAHPSMGPLVRQVNTAEFEEAIQDCATPIVVDVFAEWCGPCQAIKPFYTELAAKHKDAALFLKVDVDEMDDIAQEAGVAAMPTFMAYKGGAKIDTITGARKDALEKMVLKAIA